MRGSQPWTRWLRRSHHTRSMPCVERKASSGAPWSTCACTTCHACAVNSGALTSTTAARATAHARSGPPRPIARTVLAHLGLPWQRANIGVGLPHSSLSLTSAGPSPSCAGPRIETLVARCSRSIVARSHARGWSSRSLSASSTCEKGRTLARVSTTLQKRPLKPGTAKAVAHGGSRAARELLPSPSKKLTAARTHACFEQRASKLPTKAGSRWLSCEMAVAISTHTSRWNVCAPSREHPSPGAGSVSRRWDDLLRIADLTKSRTRENVVCSTPTPPVLLLFHHRPRPGARAEEHPPETPRPAACRRAARCRRSLVFGGRRRACPAQ